MGGVRGWEGSAAVRFPEKLARFDGTQTPGPQAGSAGRGGRKCDLVAGNNVIPRNKERRVETGEGGGKARASWATPSGRGGGTRPVRMLRGAGATRRARR